MKNLAIACVLLMLAACGGSSGGESNIRDENVEPQVGNLSNMIVGTWADATCVISSASLPNGAHWEGSSREFYTFEANGNFTAQEVYYDGRTCAHYSDQMRAFSYRNTGTYKVQSEDTFARGKVILVNRGAPDTEMEAKLNGNKLNLEIKKAGYRRMTYLRQ